MNSGHCHCVCCGLEDGDYGWGSGWRLFDIVNPSGGSTWVVVVGIADLPSLSPPAFACGVFVLSGQRLMLRFGCLSAFLVFVNIAKMLRLCSAVSSCLCWASAELCASLFLWHGWLLFCWCICLCFGPWRSCWRLALWRMCWRHTRCRLVRRFSRWCIYCLYIF